MRDRIADYTLGALDERQTREVEAHLEQCDACREYREVLTAQSEGLIALGRQVEVDMEARCERVLETLAEIPASGSGSGLLWIGRLARLAVAAVLVLGVGIAIGRLTAPQSVDVEQLRADLETSIANALKPAVAQEAQAVLDERLLAALDAANTELKAQIGAQVRRDLQAFAAEFVTGSEAMVDRRLNDLVQLIEAARLKDRQRVARAFEQVELNRRRDRTEIGRGFQSLVALTKAEPATVAN
jgi:hypothetical protein